MISGYIKRIFDNRKKLVVLITILFLCIMESYHIAKWSFTYDEALTYDGIVRGTFWGNSVSEGLHFFCSVPFWGYAANNHLLNSLGMGICERMLAGSCGIANETVLRIPIILCFLVFLFAGAALYLKGHISFVGYFLLNSSFYANDFFALARGYGMAFTFVCLAFFFLEEWEATKEYPSKLVYSILCMTIAIFAHTITLLTAAPFYMYLAYNLYKDKKYRVFCRVKYYLVLSAIALANLLLVAYHFVVSHYDQSLWTEQDGNILKLFCSFCRLYAYSYHRVLAMFLMIGFFGVVMFLYRIHSKYFTMFVLFLLITLIAADITGKGYPEGRQLLAELPVLAFGMDECVKVIPKIINRRNMSSCVSLAVTVALVWCVACGYLEAMHPDYPYFWPNDRLVREHAYATFESKTHTTIEDFPVYSETIVFYRFQIMERYGYDILQ